MRGPIVLIRRIARPLLSAAIVGEGVNALRRAEERAEERTEFESLVRVNAALQIGVGAMLASGRLPRLSSTALSGSVLPTMLNSYAFWDEQDPIIRAVKRAGFLKSLGLLGGLMIAAVDTEAKPSMGWRARRAAKRASASLSGAESTTGEALSDGLHRTAERGRDLAEVAGEGSRRVIKTAREEGPRLVETVMERGSKLADVVRAQGSELAQATKQATADLRG